MKYTIVQYIEPNVSGKTRIVGKCDTSQEAMALAHSAEKTGPGAAFIMRGGIVVGDADMVNLESSGPSETFGYSHACGYRD